MLFKQKISLKLAITLPFLVIFIITMTIMLNEQQKMYDDMLSITSKKLLQSSSRSIKVGLHHFLEDPFNANLTMRNTIEHYQLYLPKKAFELQDYLKQHFSKELNVLQQVDIIGFGSNTGDYFGFRRNKSAHTLSLFLKDQSTDNGLNIYTNASTNAPLLKTIPAYDPRLRPWYIKSKENPKAQWSDIYTNIDEDDDSILSALAPVYDKRHHLAGVLTTDVMLSSFNTFLNQEAKEISGSISILDEKGNVWIHSNHNEKYANHKIDRLKDINDPVTRETIRYISDIGFSKAITKKIITLKINGKNHFLTITPFKNNTDIGAYIVASIPESVLLGKLPEQRDRSILFIILLSLLCFTLTAYIARRLIQPIIDTANSAKALSQGEWDTPVPSHSSTKEISTLTESFELMARNLKSSFQELQDKVTYDTLTTLYSRSGLTEAISPYLSKESGLISFSINEFRNINDAIGHVSGDLLLVDIAQRLKTHYQIDNIELARIGGSEFALFFYSVKSVDELKKYAQQLHSIFNTPIQSNSGEIAIQISIGIVYELNDNNVMHWLRSASLALAQAQSTAGYITTFTPCMAIASTQKTQLTTDLAYAIKNNEFIPYYQPLIDFKTGNVQGAEALIRWQSPLYGLIPPNQFIPLAEDNGMIINIGRYILQQACSDTAKKIKSGEWPADFIIHVNVSIEQFHHSNSYEGLVRILQSSGLSAKNLSLELIESRLLNEDDTMIELMRKIRSLGVHLAIDDFGTGYSSLSYLHTLPFDCLKIDRSFVKGLNTENASTSIANAIVNIAKGFNVSIVAEGIETEEQALILKEMGCDTAQGFLYSKPLPLSSWPKDLTDFSITPS